MTDEPDGPEALPRTRNEEPQNSGVSDDDGGALDGEAAVLEALDDAWGETAGGIVADDDDGIDDSGFEADRLAAAFQAGGNVVDLAAERGKRPPDPQAGDPGPGSGDGGAGQGGGAGKKKGRGKGAIGLAAAALDEVKLVTDDAGKVYRFNGSHWDELSETAQRALATRFGAYSSANASEMTDYWQRVTHKAGQIWGRVAINEVAFINGVLNLDDLTMRPHRSEDYLERVIPHCWNPAAKADFWFECLEGWFGSADDDQVGTLQEFFGYSMAQHATYKRALVIQGETDTGKSRVAAALGRLVGQDRVCSVSIEAMDDPTLIGPIKGAAVNIVTELPEGALIRDGAFKKLVSTEEPVQINAKWKAVETYTPTAKHLILTNTLPAISDRSRATFRRLLLVFMNRLPEKLIPAGELDRRVAAEVEGVAAWAIAGLRRVYKADGEFTVTPAAATRLAAYRLEQNPLAQFVEERCRRYARMAVPTDRFLAEFNRWHAGGRHWSKTKVSREVNRLGLDGVCVKVARYNGDPIKCVVGLEIRPAPQVDEFVISGDLDADEVEASVRADPPPATAEDF